jgi:hypothetical protein
MTEEMTSVNEWMASALMAKLPENMARADLIPTRDALVKIEKKAVFSEVSIYFANWRPAS